MDRGVNVLTFTNFQAYLTLFEFKRALLDQPHNLSHHFEVSLCASRLKAAVQALG